MLISISLSVNDNPMSYFSPPVSPLLPLVSTDSTDNIGALDLFFGFQIPFARSLENRASHSSDLSRLFALDF